MGDVDAPRRRVCIVSHRLGGYDGVSVEAAKWHRGFVRLGWTVTRAAGFFGDTQRYSDVTVRGLWAPSFGVRPPAPDIETITGLCRSHDLLILDNVGSLPTSPETALVFESEALNAGIPTIVRHHDPAWQVPALATATSGRFPLHSSRMLHVAINRLTESEIRRRYPELASTGAVTTIHNTVDSAAVGRGARSATRRRLGVGEREVLLVHPARNIARKNVPAALRLAGEVRRCSGRTTHYWLTDPQGDIGRPPVGVTVHRGHAEDPADLYAAADLVVLPSHWEGWGLPVIEAAAARRPAVTFPYPVLEEIHQLGITTVDHTDIPTIIRLLSDPGAHEQLTGENFRCAARLDVRRLPRILQRSFNRAAELMEVGN